MSYDYVVVCPANEVPDISKVTEEDLKDIINVRDLITKVVPEIRWSRSQGRLETARGWMEFPILKEESDSGIKSFFIHTSHRTDHVWEEDVIRRLCAAYHWVAYDLQRDRVFRQEPSEPGAPSQGCQ